jgi:hypothetical protein
MRRGRVGTRLLPWQSRLWSTEHAASLDHLAYWIGSAAAALADPALARALSKATTDDPALAQAVRFLARVLADANEGGAP